MAITQALFWSSASLHRNVQLFTMYTFVEIIDGNCEVGKKLAGPDID